MEKVKGIDGSFERKGKVLHNKNKAKRFCDKQKDILRFYNVGKCWFSCLEET